MLSKTVGKKRKSALKREIFHRDADVFVSVWGRIRFDASTEKSTGTKCVWVLSNEKNKIRKLTFLFLS